MLSKITKGYKSLLEEANSEIETITVNKAISLHNNSDYKFIDLRNIREMKRSGKIPGAFSNIIDPNSKEGFPLRKVSQQTLPVMLAVEIDCLIKSFVG